MEKIPIVICDDEHKIINIWEDFLAEEPKIEIVGKFVTPEEYQINLMDLNPLVAVLDLWFEMEPKGYELLKWTKENTSVKVIMTSVDRYEINKLTALGSDSFLYKGNQESIVTKVLELVEESPTTIL